MPRAEKTAPANHAEATRLSISTLTHTRGVEPLDYDYSAIDAFERTIIGKLHALIDSGAVDGETLRALDGHLAAGERELKLGLDVQRTHHQSVSASIVTVAASNVAAARAALESADRQLARATKAREALELKLQRQDPEGHVNV